jgi:predicted nucleic acid-binding protein
MLRVFVDSSVLFSAAYSNKGHARDLILMAARDEIRLVISPLVIEETRRNLADFAPEVLPALEQVFDSIDFETFNPTRDEVVEAAKLVAFKDAPILAAVLLSRVDIFVTLDQKHLLDKPELERFAKCPILRPIDTYRRITGK